MIYLAVFGAMVCAFAAGYLACHLIHMTPNKQEDACQPALDQLKWGEQERTVYPGKLGIPTKKEVRKPVMRRQWSEDIPAKEDR